MALPKEVYTSPERATEFVMNTELGVKVLCILHKRGSQGITTTELQEELKYQRLSAASNLLRIFLRAGFIEKVRQDGRLIYYALKRSDDEITETIWQYLAKETEKRLTTPGKAELSRKIAASLVGTVMFGFVNLLHHRRKEWQPFFFEALTAACDKGAPSITVVELASFSLSFVLSGKTKEVPAS